MGTSVRLKFWRFAAAEVPSDRDELIAWLYDRWQVLDDWIGEMRAGDEARAGAKDERRLVGGSRQNRF